MTKKHFEALAEALAETRPKHGSERSNQWLEDVQAVCQVCKKANSNFDSDKFKQACVK